MNKRQKALRRSRRRYHAGHSIHQLWKVDRALLVDFKSLELTGIALNKIEAGTFVNRIGSQPKRKVEGFGVLISHESINGHEGNLGLALKNTKHWRHCWWIQENSLIQVK